MAPGAGATSSPSRLEHHAVLPRCGVPCRRRLRRPPTSTWTARHGGPGRAAAVDPSYTILISLCTPTPRSAPSSPRGSRGRSPASSASRSHDAADLRQDRSISTRQHRHAVVSGHRSRAQGSSRSVYPESNHDGLAPARWRSTMRGAGRTENVAGILGFAGGRYPGQPRLVRGRPAADRAAATGFWEF